MGKRFESVASKRVTLIFLLVLCLGLRLALAFYHGDDEIKTDAAVYVHIAQNIADGRGFVADTGYGGLLTGVFKPSAHGYVFYPYFLAGLMYLFNAQLLGISIAQSLIDTLTCLLVYFLAFHVTSRRLAAVCASLIYAIYPPFIISSCQAMTETTTTAIVVAALYLLVKALHGNKWSFVLAGVFMGFTILAKSAMLAFPLWVIIILFLARRRVSELAAKAAIYVVAAYLVVCPWTIRNYIVFHTFVPVTTNMGMVLWGATGPYDGMCLTPEYPVDTKARNLSNDSRIPDVNEATFQKVTKLRERIRNMNEIQRDAVLKRAAIQEVKDHPGRMVLLVIKKPIRLWFNLWNDLNTSLNSYGIAAINAVLLLLAWFGYRKYDVDENYKLVTIHAVIYTTLISLATCTTIRYSYPIMPLIIILAAVCIAGLLSRKKVISI